MGDVHVCLAKILAEVSSFRSRVVEFNCNAGLTDESALILLGLPGLDRRNRRYNRYGVYIIILGMRKSKKHLKFAKSAAREGSW